MGYTQKYYEIHTIKSDEAIFACEMRNDIDNDHELYYI